MKNCIYFVEGECEKQLLSALIANPSLILPGKVKVRNVINSIIPMSELIGIKPKTDVVLLFDTDVCQTDILRTNIKNIKKCGSSITVVTVLQIPNLEKELILSTDVSDIKDLTRSKSVSDFKHDFCKMNDCRYTLERHSFDINKIWIQKSSGVFSFLEQQGNRIKK